MPDLKGKKHLSLEVVIMAGGRGERLRPLTDDTPKPLLRVGEKPIVEYSILRLIKAGVKDFTFVVNYLGEKIEAYFGDGSRYGVNFHYCYEQEPLGTIGGISHIPDLNYEHLLVINGDLLTTIQFDKFFGWYLDQGADMAVASIPYEVDLSYGILELGGGHEVKSIREKPNYTYYINTGIYLFRRELLQLIPSGNKYDAVELIEESLTQGKKVVSFPLLDYWLDIGRMEDFRKAQKEIEFLDLG